MAKGSDQAEPAVVVDRLSHPGAAAGPWAFAGASVMGTSHARSGLPCQDRHVVRVVNTAKGEFLVAAVSDGAGSAPFSRHGALVACERFVISATAALDQEGLAGLSGEWVEEFLARLRNEIVIMASARAARPRDFACTLLGAVVGDGASVFLQVGDGAIVVAGRTSPGTFDVVVWPQQGEFANQTFFVTEPDAVERYELVEAPQAVDEIALFTDGLQAMVLDYASRLPHQPFFESMLAPVRQADVRGTKAGIGEALARFLGSARVNERTDDDKTLVIASRRCEKAPTPREAPAAESGKL